jgi:YgiT-type zinc finger domain-containing protein
MSRRKKNEECPWCGGDKKPGTTTFTVELGFGVVVIREVPALVCNQCGADWISDKVAERIEAIVAKARKNRVQVEVMAFV